LSYILATGQTLYQTYALENGLLRISQDHIQINNSRCVIYGNEPSNRPKELEESSRALTRIN